MVESSTLYRKYRGRKFSEIVGQDHITNTLERAIGAGKISHAYLFTGPHGVGKTSVARILACEVNGLPYEGDLSHLDVIEIDAASNRRIDEIRELREKVHTAPTSAKFKVYIIDEVHMLTKEAFNALLKTLEEPPAHVIFILATTEAHKLPATIISRTQQHSFRAISEQDIVKHLKHIAKKEGIKIDDDAVELLAAQGNGSFRDSISLLDRISHSLDGDISAKAIQQLIGQAPQDVVASLLESVTQTPTDVNSQLDQAYNLGVVPAELASQLSAMLRQQFIDGHLSLEAEQALQLIDSLSDVSRADDSRLKLEVLLYKTCLDSGGTVKNPPATKSVKLKSPPKAQQPDTKPASPTPISGEEFVAAPQDKWNSTATAVKHKNNTLYAALRMAKAEWNGSCLRLSFKFPFHQARVSTSANTDIISSAASDAFGQPVKIEAIVDKSLSAEPPKMVLGEKDQEIDRVLDAFGGGEAVTI